MINTGIETRVEALEARIDALESRVDGFMATGSEVLNVSRTAMPIGHPIVKDKGLHNYSEKFGALLDIGESVIKYSTVVALARLAASGSPGVYSSFKAGVTLGKWVEQLRFAVDTPSNEWPLPRLRATFRVKSKYTGVARYLFEEFVNLRNRERGHGSQQAEGYYEDLYRSNELLVYDAVRASSIVGINLVNIKGIDHAGSEGYSYNITTLMGTSAFTVDSPVFSHMKVKKGDVCLWNGGDEFLSLSPLLICRYCRSCGTEHPFFFDKVKGNKAYYHSYQGNHRIDTEIPSELQ